MKKFDGKSSANEEPAPPRARTMQKGMPHQINKINALRSKAAALKLIKISGHKEE